MKSAELCEPLLLLGNHVRSGHYIQADETTLRVLTAPKESADQKKQYMWLYRAGPLDQKATYFDYQISRAGKHAQEFLSGFKGYLQTDGYNGCDWVNKEANIVHLACMAHAQRPFAKLIKIAKKTEKSYQAVTLIKKLYAIKKKAKDESLTPAPKARYRLRLKEAVPILEKIKAWLETSLQGAPPER